MMEGVPEFFMAISLLIMLSFVLVNLFGLPGNIAALLIPVFWAFGDRIAWETVMWIGFTVAMGELIEFLASYYIGKRYGVSNASFIASIIGSIIGGIMGASLLLGFGAVLGTFAGAFAGTWIYEYLKYSDTREAARRGLATFAGRFLGIWMKLVLGFIAVFQTYRGLASFIQV
ncbi:DUF456 domain-containing protein [Limisalsivibrio acetivorans]|uniref:DUF456 domain-containing protein n=1 Tax=Limisalsivibrio acetivorans TaxID=1304888 RepID=UPI0003B68AC2|nr:DUF456 domain-containing protein [Limisalsivibrio acetivorans]